MTLALPTTNCDLKACTTKCCVSYRRMQNTNASITPDTTSWIETELAGIDLADERLNNRAKRIMRNLSSQPSASIPQACEEWSEIKGTYRFLSNDRIKPEQLLEPHVLATLRRMQSHKVILAVQDTTTLNYSTHRDTEGLGPISNNPDKTLGFFLHATLAVTPQGCPLGLLQVTAQSRDKKDFGSSRRSQDRNTKAISAKESQRWLDSLSRCQQLAKLCPDTTIINIADREGDIYEVFAQALQSLNSQVHALTRVQHNRNVENDAGRLWSHLAKQPQTAAMQVNVPRRAGQKARLATLSIRFAPVTICAPCLKEQNPSLPLWAIEAREEHPPKGVKPILWQLITTFPVADAQEAMECIKWYAQRWQIEVLHKVLKSGCKIEQRQLGTVARLKRVLILDLILAWRIMYLSKILREHPNASASVYLAEAEWKVLGCRFNPTRTSPSVAPSIAQAVRWIAQLGGFIGRKSDGDPGPIVLWRGLHRLHDLAHCWSLRSCG